MSENPETPSEIDPADAKFWLAEISAAQSRMDEWYAQADDAQERYDACPNDDDQPFGSVNILYSNVDTQISAIGEEFGAPQVTRVNPPEDDGGLSRHVANVWEKSIAAAVRDTNDNHDISLAVRDVFLPGRGQVWQELEVSEGESDYSNGKSKKTKWVCAPIVYLKHKDYLQGQADRWGSVPWVARRHTFTYDELVSECKMSMADAEKVPLNITLPNNKKDEANAQGKEQFQRAEVWEIWAKYPKKSRIHVAIGYNDEVLRSDPDPFKLRGFFPCPRPMVPNGTECTLPLTDYSRYENQASELDELSSRIFILTGCLRRVGIHDKAFKELSDLAEVEENTTLAVENWAALMTAGGLNKVQDWQDITPIAEVLVGLHQQRDTLMKLIYEISGISDLARGHTDPDETATAQNLKQSFGSNRFRRREKESRRFAAEAYQIKGEVIAELFPREQLQEMSGIALPLQKDIDSAQKQLGDIQNIQQQAQQARQALQQLQTRQQHPQGPQAPGQPQQGAPGAPVPPQPVMPSPQQIQQLQNLAKTPPPDQKQIAHLMRIAKAKFSWEDVSEVLQSDYRRCYVVEIETDQTAFMDQESDKQSATQLFQVATQSLTTLAPMIAGNPKVGDVYKKLFMFVLSRFRAGRAMEGDFERLFDEAIQMATQQQGQQQHLDPKTQAEMAIAQAKQKTAEAQQATATIKLQQTQMEAQQAPVKAQQEAFSAQTKAQADAAKVQSINDANQAKQAGNQIDNINKAEKLQFERQTRATAEEALLYGPTQEPHPVAAQ